MRIDPKLNEEVVALGGLSREELVAAWGKAYGCPPPAGIRNEMLVRSAAWHCQAKRLGGFSADTKRSLKQAMRRAEAEIERRLRRAKAGGGVVASGNAAASHGSDDDRIIDLAAGYTEGGHSVAGVMATRGDGIRIPSPRHRQPPGIGARLLRDWNGRTHVVDVVEGGFVFEGRTHRSLSAIAKLITGAHWSGPRFFGL